MSGGSYNYLFVRDEWDAEDLTRMGDRLAELGLPREADRTYSLIAPRIAQDDPLRDLWRAVEWRDSGDDGEETLAANIEKYRAAADAYRSRAAAA